MWGQVRRCGIVPLKLGIIPTRVGTRLFPIFLAPFRWDHPHACGDKLFLVGFLRYSAGSSPRVWGQDSLQYTMSSAVRISPTRVGTSTDNTCTVRRYKDHPHACGDKELAESIKVNGLGSSPRVWGQDSQDIICTPFFRIIPTRVGTSG